MRKRTSEAGDTLVEVLLAMTVLSAILFISWNVVNRASQISLAARQRTVLVNALKEQAEIIKSKYPTGPSATLAAQRFTVISSSDISTNPCEDSRDDTITNGTTPSNSFYFNPANAQLVKDQMKSIESYSDSKVWVQLKQVGTTGSGYIDFYIRGCWVTSGSVQREDNSQFVVRLNI